MEVLLDQPELSQVPNKSQRLLQAKFDFIIMQLFPYLLCFKKSIVKFIYSEKAPKFCKIFTLLLSYVVPVKSKVKISQNFKAFSEYMNFSKILLCRTKFCLDASLCSTYKF